MSVEFSPAPAQPKPASRNEASASRSTSRTAADTSSVNDFSNLLDFINDGADAGPADQAAPGDKETNLAAKTQAHDQPDLQANQPVQFTQTFQLGSATPRPAPGAQARPGSLLAGKGEPGLTVTSQPAPLDVTLATTAATVAQAQIGALAAAGKAESGTLPAPRLDPAGIAEEKYQKSSTTNGVVATNREASEMLLAVEMRKQFSRSQGAAKAVVKAGIDDAVQAQTAIVLKDVHDVSRKPSIVDIFQIGFASPEVVVAAVAAGVEKSPAERLSERRQIPDGPGGAWGSDLIGTGNRLDTVDAGNTSSFSAEMSVAEQVTYWVTHDVQTAELKLDGMGHEPVEVSISLRGNEAHVAFRTDQLETRQVLEGAVAQLKELLRGEGLVLSGVSVGSSGQNGSNPQDRRDRQGSRQTSVNAPELMTADASQRLPRHSGRAIDLFV